MVTVVLLLCSHSPGLIRHRNNKYFMHASEGSINDPVTVCSNDIALLTFLQKNGYVLEKKMAYFFDCVDYPTGRRLIFLR